MSDEQEDKRWESRLRDKRLWEEIGKQIRQGRMAKKMNVEEFSAQVDLAPQTVYRLEIGLTGTTMSRLADICRLLDLDASHLLGLADDSANQFRVAMRGRHLTQEQLQQIIAFARNLTRDD